MEVKSDKQVLIEKFQDFNQILKTKDEELAKYKENVQIQFEAKQKI